MPRRSVSSRLNNLMVYACAPRLSRHAGAPYPTAIRRTHNRDSDESDGAWSRTRSALTGKLDSAESCHLPSCYVNEVVGSEVLNHYRLALGPLPILYRRDGPFGLLRNRINHTSSIENRMELER